MHFHYMTNNEKYSVGYLSSLSYIEGILPMGIILKITHHNLVSRLGTQPKNTHFLKYIVMNLNEFELDILTNNIENQHHNRPWHRH